MSYQQTSPHAHTPAFPRIKTYPLSVGSISTESPIWGSGTDRARRTADLLSVSAIGAVLVGHGAKTWAAKRKGGGGKPPVSSPPHPPIPLLPYYCTCGLAWLTNNRTETLRWFSARPFFFLERSPEKLRKKKFRRHCALSRRIDTMTEMISH